MKMTKICSILTALMIFTLIASPNSFARDYVVRLVYLLPSDRAPRPDIDITLDTEIKDAQKLFADIMEEHGFGRKTFRFETNARGMAVVHHVRGKHTAAHYYTNPYNSGAIDEVSEHFDLSSNIYLISIDMGIVDDHGTACFSGNLCGFAHSHGGTSGIAVVSVGNRFSAIAHELGHTFGLSHNYSFIGYNKDPMLHRFSAAEWLDVSPYFNDTRRFSNSPTTIEMLSASPAPNFATRLRFLIKDLDGLHQVQLLTQGGRDSVRWEDNGDYVTIGPAPSPYDFNVKDYKILTGVSNTVEFVTQEVATNFEKSGMVDQTIYLHVIDVHGNITFQHFTIDVRDALPIAEATKGIPIPDRNLAASLRETLGLPPNAPITKLDMLRLENFTAVGRQIKNLTGLEHAIFLRNVNLLGNQVRDITPLLKLPLFKLYIHGNQIRDLRPLKALTSLVILDIGENPFRDITVLRELKHLRVLNLHSNPINDISPVWELTQLAQLSIRFMKIQDLSPITKLTRLSLLQLDDNGISDISPLAALTNLQILTLWRNPISDVSPLTSLTNLQDLNLQGIPIENRKPLHAMLQKNPDLKISLTWDGEPLTLSDFRAEQQEPIHHTLKRHTAAISSITFSPDGNRLATGSRDGTARLWNANTGKHIRAWDKESVNGNKFYEVNGVAFSPNGNQIGIATYTAFAQLWNANTGKLIHWFNTGSAYSVAFSPNGNQIGIVAGSGISLWNVNTGKLIRELNTREEGVQSIAFSPDGKLFATGSRDGTARLWNANTGKHIREWKSTNGWNFGDVRSVAFSPNGNQLAIATYNAGTQLYNANTGKHIREFNTGSVDSVAFSPNGKQLATILFNGRVRLYNVNTGKRIRTFEEDSIATTSMGFSPDGKRLALGRVDGSFRIWELEAPKVVEMPDKNLAKAVRTALKLGPNAHITDTALETLTHLDARKKKIKNLTGLEHAKALKTLDLDENEITNVGPLTGLKQLEWLLIGGGGNKIGNTGVRRLSDLTRLRGLSLWDSQIGNITPLAKLTKLESLWLDYNEIRDISALSKLVNLRTLHLRDNKIRDVSPLAKLTKLESLRLAGNPIQNTAPLEKLLAQNPDMELDIEVVGVGAAPTARREIPTETALLANYPNPFNPETWIPYHLAEPANVMVRIYAADGILVQTLILGHQPAGMYQSRVRAAYWDGRNALGEPVASGIYFYTFTAGDFTATRKMLIRK